MVDVWVFTVSDKLPRNWELGRDNLIWASPVSVGVKANDLLLFREGRKTNRVLALALAAEDQRYVVDSALLPWQDPNDPEYKYQWALDDIREPATDYFLSWTQIQTQVLGSGDTAQAPRRSKLPVAQVLAALARGFGGELVFPDINVESAEPGGDYSRSRRNRTAWAEDRVPSERRSGEFEGETQDSRLATAEGSIRHEKLLFHFRALVQQSGGTDFAYGTEDLVWRSGNTMHIAEVKSTIPANEVSQLRLGLGQVLQYLFEAKGECEDLRGWLVVESKPRDPDLWTGVCESVGVRLWWPGRPL